MKPQLESSVGRKFLVSITGLVLYGFVVLHMLGNLKIFMGVDPVTNQYKMDLYAVFLREMGSPMLSHGQALWLTRGLLFIAMIVHLYLVTMLTFKNKSARPVSYVKTYHGSSTFSSRTMFIGGIGILAFLIYHILHMTTGTLHHDGFQEGAVYHNVISAFQLPLTAAIYVAAVGLLGFHLYHGVWSLFQTLGVTSSGNNRYFKGLATASAIVVFIGFAAVPMAVALGFVH